MSVLTRPAPLFKRPFTVASAAHRIREVGALACFTDLHDLTHGLSGRVRMDLFDSLPPLSRKAMAANLRTKLEAERP